jgi:hypothetical protein
VWQFLGRVAYRLNRLRVVCRAVAGRAEATHRNFPWLASLTAPNPEKICASTEETIDPLTVSVLPLAREIMEPSNSNVRPAGTVTLATRK